MPCGEEPGLDVDGIPLLLFLLFLRWLNEEYVRQKDDVYDDVRPLASTSQNVSRGLDKKKIQQRKWE